MKDKTAETSQQAEPWESAQPFLRQLIGGSMGAYGSGQFDIPPYMGPRVAPQSGLTQQAMQGFYDTGMSGNPFYGAARGAYPGLAQFSPMSTYSRQGMGQIADMQGDNPYSGQARSLFSNIANADWQQHGQPTDTAQVANRIGLTQFANADPYRDLDTLKSNVLGDVVPAVASRFANSGMLDSSLAADTMSRSAAEAVAPIEYGAWENAQNRRLSAMQTMAPHEYAAQENAANRGLHAWGQQQGNLLQALGLTPELMQSRYIDPGMMMQAGAQADQYGLNQRNQQLSALGHAPSLSGLRYQDPQMMAQAGASQDIYGQRLADASQATYYEQMMRPYNMLQMASGLGLGFGGMGQSGSGTETQPGNGLWGAVGDVGQMALLGGKLWGMSDRRLKRDIERIGETAEGYPKYRYRYEWDEPGTERIGVMADEVPEEITSELYGFKMVNYAEVTL